MAGDPSLDWFSFEEEYDGDNFNPLVEQEFVSEDGQSLGICGFRDGTGVRLTMYESNDRVICKFTKAQVEEIYNLIGKHLGK